jgi:serine/threonine-protein kinase
MTPAPYEELRQRLIRQLEGRYKVGRLLGAGGMAAVFRAQDISLDRVVAIKVLPPDFTHDDKGVSRFEQEARIAAKLDHPNIIPIYRVESENGLNYFVMKYVAGKSLDSILMDGKPLDLEFTQRVLDEAAAALGHAHRRGVVHRDVKPANIMLDEDGRVILTDFGISKAVESASGLTRTGMIVGTPHYMAPEQAMGQDVDGRADQYALACVGYHMLTGELPFPGDVVHSVLHRHIYEQAKPLSAARRDAPAPLVRALDRAMAKEPKERFASMEEFAGATTMLTTGSRPVRRGGVSPTVSVEAPTAPTNSSATIKYEQTMQSSRRWRVLRWTAALAAVAAGGVFIARQQTAAVVPPPAPVQAESTFSHPESTMASGAVPVDSTRDTAAAVPLAVAVPKPSKIDRLIHRNTPRPKPPAPPPAASADTALFSINSAPYGMLFVNGREIDNTPVINLKLAVGQTYEVRVERDGYRTYRETIHVQDRRPITRSPNLAAVP